MRTSAGLRARLLLAARSTRLSTLGLHSSLAQDVLLTVPWRRSVCSFHTTWRTFLSRMCNCSSRGARGMPTATNVHVGSTGTRPRPKLRKRSGDALGGSPLPRGGHTVHPERPGIYYWVLPVLVRTVTVMWRCGYDESTIPEIFDAKMFTPRDHK